MDKYICFSLNKEQFDVKDNSLDMNGERKVYYAKSICKQGY